MNAGVSIPGPGFGLVSHTVPYKDMAQALRVLATDVEKSDSGDAGLTVSMADVVTVLYTRFLKFDRNHHEQWTDRDRVVLATGHCSMLLYAQLHLAGYLTMGIEALRRTRKIPDNRKDGLIPGVEATAGTLGQSLANAVGMALAERMLASRYGAQLVDHHTYVIAGDSCLMEGISHEAMSLAGHLRLNKLIVLFDDYRHPVDGAAPLPCSDDLLQRFVATGWSVKSIDGHNHQQIDEALDAARSCHRPSLIACRTTSRDCNESVSLDVLGVTRQQSGPTLAPLEIAERVRRAWHAVGEHGGKAYESWVARLMNAPAEIKQRFLNEIRGHLNPELAEAFVQAKRVAATMPNATSVSSQKILDLLVMAQPNLIGSSTDTQEVGTSVVSRDDYSGRYVHFGARENAMMAAMNGISLHGGFIPFGLSSLASSDYGRPAIRLSALMRRRVIYMMSQDSTNVDVGRPTHWPAEHLAALRAVPNLQVFRPADAVETVEAWEVALKSERTPSVLCLSSRNLPLLRTTHSDVNRSERGGYVLRHAREPRRATLIASGSEVSIAIEAAQHLHIAGIEVAVVSMPCFELFAQQSDEYRARVLGEGPRVAIEAGVRDGWDRWIGARGCFVGMTDFSANAPSSALCEHFGISVERVIDIVRKRLESHDTEISSP